MKPEAKSLCRDSQGRAVIDIEFSRNNDGSAFIVAAHYDDDGSPVPDGELDYLTDTLPELCDEYALESDIMAAEYAFEGDR